MTEIIPGIYQLRIPIPNSSLGHTNSYLIKGDGEVLIIDPGSNTDEAFQTLKEELSRIDVSIESITHILATHPHRDHYGLCGRVKQQSQARIFLHRVARDFIQSIYSNMEARRQQLDQWFHANGAPIPEPSEIQMLAQRMLGLPISTMPDVILEGGETISINGFTINVLWTPGHSPGHICLYEPTKKILLSGDHVLPVITPHISLPPDSDPNPLGDFLDSLNKLKQLDIKLVLPAHENIFTDLPTRVEEIIQHHKRRNSEILGVLKADPETAYQISEKITWVPDQGGVSFHDLTLWDKRMAVSETLAHLEAMRVDGRIAKFSKNSAIYYHTTDISKMVK
ncbi:MBL fold metallo-hydrolase [Chloroflexota bacterium]